MEKCIIVVPTFSSYLDLCEIYLEFVKKNWQDCPYKIVVSVVGEQKMLSGVECVYIGENGKLTDCIVKVADMYKSDYYICMLGDALINKPICTSKVRKLMSNLKRENIEYCRIKPSIKNSGNMFRKVIWGESYVYTFAAFIATQNFIYNELKGISDYDFEKKYINDWLENNCQNYENYAILSEDVFNIVSGICKGKWDRKSIRVLERNNPEIIVDWNDRGKLGMIPQLKMELFSYFSDRLNLSKQYKVKVILKKLGFKFEI